MQISCNVACCSMVFTEFAFKFTRLPRDLCVLLHPLAHCLATGLQQHSGTLASSSQRSSYFSGFLKLELQ
jgi:hypothetical protein